MARVARKLPEPTVDAAPLNTEAKPRKKHTAASQPKYSTPWKTQYYTHPQSAGKVTSKKRSLPGATRRKTSTENTTMRIPKQPSETALALLIQEQMSETANLNEPEQSEPGLDSTHVCVEDLTSSETESTVEDLRNINA